jgi:ADP-heptose:LPS heptosyltransferase
MSHPPPNPIPTKPPLGLYGGNVLIAAPSRWDEACFSAPVVRAIRLARPTCILAVVCPEEQIAYWKSSKKINCVIGYGPKHTYRVMLREQLESELKWESAILWERNEGAELAVDLKVRQRLGYATKDLKKWLTDEVTVDASDGAPEHRVQHYLRFAERLKITTNHPELFQSLPQGISAGKRAILVSPESDYGDSYEWQEQSWLQLLHWLRETLRTEVRLVSCGRGKSKLAERLGAASGLPLERWESLENVLPIVAEHALAICADSSLCHLTAHCGVTTVSLFGPGDPHWRRPLGRQHAVVRRKAECSPCLLAKCPMDLRCQKEISVEECVEAILQKYSAA